MKPRRSEAELRRRAVSPDGVAAIRREQSDECPDRRIEECEPRMKGSGRHGRNAGLIWILAPVGMVPSCDEGRIEAG